MASTYEIKSQQSGRDINQAAGDIFIINEQQSRETEFFEPNLEPFESPNYISPKITHLIETICQNRLLILGGNTYIDKLALVRYLSWCLSKKPQGLDPAGSKLPVLEWNRSSSGIQNVERYLRETTNSAIFILPKISPQDVSYDLMDIKKIADTNKHFVLISTDAPYLSWKLTDVDQRFWQEITDDIYSIEDLANFLKESLPKDFLSILSEQDIPRTAKKLKTPENISIFIELLCGERKALRSPVINDIIKDVIDKERTIKRWYLALNKREQLLALGLSFFDGLFDDQFFAAMDRVVSNVWQRRNLSLRAFDYSDLDNLRNFFDFIPDENHEFRIESRIQKQRLMLFKVAWNSHRRQILAALPVIAQLAANSVAHRSYDLELYGTKLRRYQLRMAISETLSDIGLISKRAVQSTLGQLAADEELGVQVVAARAMARWRQEKEDNRLFEMLESWCRSQRDDIRAAAALTISYAAHYDAQNNLDKELCKMLGILSKDMGPLVRKRFSSHILPDLVPRQIMQLDGVLHDLTQNIDLIQEIAKSLAFTYSHDREAVNNILTIWEQECKEIKLESGNSEEITQRETLLATIALTYGYINYDDQASGLTAKDAFKWLQKVLEDEKNVFVHKKAQEAIKQLSSRYFEEVEQSLQNLVIKADQSESEEFLKDIYLEQRQRLPGGDDFIEIGGKQIPIWFGPTRPKTDVETAMERWIKSQENPVTQQIAVRALKSFAHALDQEEEQQITEILEERTHPILPPEPEKPIIAANSPVIKKITSIEKIAVWVATFGNRPYNAIIQGILPEILYQNKHNETEMTFILEKWQKTTDSELNEIAQYLKNAIWLIEHPKLMVASPLLVLALLVAVAVQNFVLFIILILVMIALVFYKFRSSLAQNQENIKNISTEQITLWLKDNLKR